MSKRPAARWPCVARLSFLLARQPVTRRAKACGRCPVDGGVHEFPLQGSEACRKRQKTRKRGGTPAIALSSNQGVIAMFFFAEEADTPLSRTVLACFGQKNRSSDGTFSSMRFGTY